MDTQNITPAVETIVTTATLKTTAPANVLDRAQDNIGARPGDVLTVHGQWHSSSMGEMYAVKVWSEHYGLLFADVPASACNILTTATVQATFAEDDATDATTHASAWRATQDAS